MENIKKENILKRIFNSIKAGWDRMGEVDVEDYELEMPEELTKPLQAESILSSKNSKETSSWRVDNADNTISVKTRSQNKEKSVSKDDDYVIE